ncbi:AB hydrolase superfamily protein YdjP [Paraconexibacter sp. AEG42_29]|uniref:AB hydrolase superfamily protein YdjP n=1 Tax=Paraconexibacter sp. AEG42_29 TaxID=2997339 RepID=A0AAU7B143_9ACTN
MPLIAVEPRVEIYAQDIGDGPPVVLLHGWAFDHRIWDRQVGALADAGHRVVCVDLRGHGRSDRPYGDYSVERLGQDVVAVLDTLELEDVTLVGWSLGGLTAFRVATTSSSRLRRLVLVASNGVATTRKPTFPFGAPAEAHEEFVITREKADRLESRRSLIAGAFAQQPTEALIARVLELTLATPSWAGAATLSTLMQTDQVAGLADLRVPVAQIVGEKDPIFSHRAGAWLAEQIPDLHRITLDGCGHYPMIEAPDAFDAALLKSASL